MKAVDTFVNHLVTPHTSTLGLPPLHAHPRLKSPAQTIKGPQDNHAPHCDFLHQWDTLTGRKAKASATGTIFTACSRNAALCTCITSRDCSDLEMKEGRTPGMCNVVRSSLLVTPTKAPTQPNHSARDELGGIQKEHLCAERHRDEKRLSQP